jgi:hypothetical protein
MSENKELLVNIDELYSVIDLLNKEDIDKIIKYCEEQLIIVDISDKRKKSLANQLRIERIKFRKELNDIKNKIKQNKEEEFISDSDEEIKKSKKMKNKK